jgi:predicted GNAT family N-acyltransferase
MLDCYIYAYFTRHLPQTCTLKPMDNQTYNVSLAEWRVDYAALSQIRFTVFVREQGVPPELELDEADANPQLVVHAIARDADGNAIATGRLVLDSSTPRVGRMAVLRQWRGHGVGKAILDFFCQYAKQHGYQTVRLNSQTHATPFYYKQGFLSHGSEFVEAGIPHLEMRRKL